MVELYNQPGCGRNKTFDSAQEEQIKDWVKYTPKNLDKVQEKIKKQWQIKVSKKTIKRVIKSIKMGWHRIKRKVGGEPCPGFYQRKVEELKELKSKGEIEIRYVDESGFC